MARYEMTTQLTTLKSEFKIMFRNRRPPSRLPRQLEAAPRRERLRDEPLDAVAAAIAEGRRRHGGRQADAFARARQPLLDNLAAARVEVLAPALGLGARQRRRRPIVVGDR